MNVDRVIASIDGTLSYTLSEKLSILLLTSMNAQNGSILSGNNVVTSSGDGSTMMKIVSGLACILFFSDVYSSSSSLTNHNSFSVVSELSIMLHDILVLVFSRIAMMQMTQVKTYFIHIHIHTHKGHRLLRSSIALVVKFTESTNCFEAAQRAYYKLT